MEFRLVLFRSAADRFQADVGDRIARRLVLDDLTVDPQGEVGIVAVDFVRKSGLEGRRREIFRDPVIFGLREIGAEREEGLEFLLDLTPEFLFAQLRSEEHTSELQSLMRISYAVFCLKQKKN